MRVDKVYIPDRVDEGPIYDPALDSPYLNIAPYNLALLKIPHEITNEDGQSL